VPQARLHEEERDHAVAAGRHQGVGAGEQLPGDLLMTYVRDNGGLSRNDLVPRWPLYQLQHERGLVPTTVMVRVLTVVGTAEGERVVQSAAGVNLGRSREENRS